MTPLRVVLVGGADMLQDVVRQIVDDDPALELVGEAATVEDVAALWKRVEAEVVVVRVLATDVPAWVLPAGPDAHIPAVVGLDPRGTRGVIILEDISRIGLAAAIRAAAKLHDPKRSELTMCQARRAGSLTLKSQLAQLVAGPVFVSCEELLGPLVFTIGQPVSERHICTPYRRHRPTFRYPVPAAQPNDLLDSTTFTAPRHIGCQDGYLVARTSLRGSSMRSHRPKP